MKITANNIRESRSNKWIKRISKLACGKSVIVPGYATVRAYKTPHGRRFAISKVESFIFPAGGNLTMKHIKLDLAA